MHSDRRLALGEGVWVAALASLTVEHADTYILCASIWEIELEVLASVFSTFPTVYRKIHAACVAFYIMCAPGMSALRYEGPMSTLTFPVQQR